MKKFFIICTLLIAVGASSFSQVSPFKPIPFNLFQILGKTNLTMGSPTIPTATLWRFDAQVIGNELTYNKVTKQIDSAPLSGVGPGFGIRHYFQGNNGLPTSDWGLSLAILLGTDLQHVTPASIKPAIVFNALQFVNVGVDLINFKQVGFIMGAQVNF